ncbi:MAG: MlaD family protein, partial [Parachlamydiaceae bacterium]
MNDPIKNILIGLFVFAAGLLVVFVILFLHPTVGDDAQTLRVRFANIDKVSTGTRVTYGGKPVGEVVEIRDIEEPQEARKAGKDGFVYIYELVLKLDSKVNAYNTDQVSLRTSGLLGEKSVEITPQAAKPGQKPRLVTEEIIYANETGSVEETLKEFKELSDKIEATLDSIKFAVDELNKRNIWE